MSARQAAETARAMHLHLHEHKTVAEAARMCGIWRSTLYRALEKLPKKKVKK